MMLSFSGEDILNWQYVYVLTLTTGSQAWGLVWELDSCYLPNLVMIVINYFMNVVTACQ